MSAATDSPRADLACAIDDCGEEITDGFILAALERAECQTGSSEVWLRVFVEHLGLEPTAPTSRRLRPDLGYLCHAGLLRRGEAKGRERWSLTAEGREELARSRAADVIRDLPESPQHRAWREARIRARVEFSGFRLLVDAALDEAQELGIGHQYAASGTASSWPSDCARPSGSLARRPTAWRSGRSPRTTSPTSTPTRDPPQGDGPSRPGERLQSKQKEEKHERETERSRAADRRLRQGERRGDRR